MQQVEASATASLLCDEVIEDACDDDDIVALLDRILKDDDDLPDVGPQDQ